MKKWFLWFGGWIVILSVFGLLMFLLQTRGSGPLDRPIYGTVDAAGNFFLTDLGEQLLRDSVTRQDTALEFLRSSAVPGVTHREWRSSTPPIVRVMVVEQKRGTSMWDSVWDVTVMIQKEGGNWNSFQYLRPTVILTRTVGKPG